MKRLIKLATVRPETRFWYARQKHALQAYCKKQGWDFKTFCDVLAITSPRVQLKRNWKFACQYMAGETFYCNPMPQIIECLRHYEQTGEIRGPKTSRFALALQGKQDIIVLDIWMSRLLVVDYDKIYSPKIYARLSRKIEKVARALQWTPAQTQAALWCNFLLQNNRRIYSYVDLIS